MCLLTFLLVVYYSGRQCIMKCVVLRCKYTAGIQWYSMIHRQMCWWRSSEARLCSDVKIFLIFPPGSGDCPNSVFSDKCITLDLLSPFLLVTPPLSVTLLFCPLTDDAASSPPPLLWISNVCSDLRVWLWTCTPLVSVSSSETHSCVILDQHIRGPNVCSFTDDNKLSFYSEN